MKLKQLAKKISPRGLQIYRKIRGRKLKFLTPIRTPEGFFFSGLRSMMTGTYEINETNFIRSILPNYERVINVGANLGYYTCLSAHHGKETIALEPHPENVRLLLRNVISNNFDAAVEVLPVAAASSPGALKFYGMGTSGSLIPGWAHQFQSTLVPVTTLDRLFASTPSRGTLFIVDVEGAETELLAGAKKVLSTASKVDWFIELNIDEHLPQGETVNRRAQQAFETFFSAGYRCEEITARPRSVHPDEIARIFSTGKNTLGSHNFFFTKG